MEADFAEGEAASDCVHEHLLACLAFAVCLANEPKIPRKALKAVLNEAGIAAQLIASVDHDEL